MRRTAIAPAIVLGLSSFVPSAPAQAAGGIPGLNDCPTYGDVHICSGEVTSWDGSPLDVDLTLPEQQTGDHHPLIVMLHGFGNNKHEWESLTDEGDNADKWHWNNHWFAERGFYVLTYTARGFFDDGTTRDDQPATPAGRPALCPARGGSACPPNGTIHLKSREFEIRDTQWLAALVAEANPDLNRNEVAVTGGSYGGGESWLQASQPTWDVNTFAPPAAGSPPKPVLNLQAAIPKYPWTDLGYSLAPNGHPGPFDTSIYSSSQGSPTDPSDTGRGNPIGNAKFSYVSGFFFQGLIDGIFENGTTTTPSQEGPINLTAWATRALAGDPYDVNSVEDPLVAQMRRGLTEFRGAFYQDEAWNAETSNREVAIFSVSGWTDDLFPPVESFRLFKYLKSLDRLWPVEVAVGDVGHPRAQNPPAEWHHINDQAWGFLKEQIHGSHRQQTNVISMPTICPASGEETGPIEQLTGRTPEGLSHGTLSIAYSKSGTLRNPGRTVEDPDNLATDPVLGFLANAPGCRQSVAAALPDPTARFTDVSEPLTQPEIFVGLARVHLTYTLLGATTTTVNARVWDVAPDGTTFLMTRGTYRIDTPAYNTAAQTIDLPLFGNQWTVQAGHRIRLDLTQSDYPTFLPSNSSAVLMFPPPTLVLPTREAAELTISDS